jgi:hypothetical protein
MHFSMAPVILFQLTPLKTCVPMLQSLNKLKGVLKFQAYSFFRDFVFGSCKLGSVISPKPGVTAVIGGEDPLLEGVIRGQDEIYYGFGATQSTYVFPKATREAWKTFNTAYQPVPTS